MENNTNKILSPAASAALVKALSEVSPPKFDSVNPRFGSKYASLQSHLEALREPFLRNGWAIIQHPSQSANTVGVTTMLIHTSGEAVTFEASIPVDPANFDAQKAGSAYSYLRRYSLAAIGFTAGDSDTDANEATPVVTSSTGVFKQPAAEAKKRPSGPASTVPGTWREVVLHFGKNKGTKLGDLPAASLDWYAKEWQPKPYNGSISEADVILRGALDSYLSAKSNPGQVEPPSDDVPF